MKINRKVKSEFKDTREYVIGGWPLKKKETEREGLHRIENRK